MQPPSPTRFQLAILDEVPFRADETSNLGSLDWLWCRRTSDHSYDFYKGDLLVSSIDLKNPKFDLSHLLGIIVVGSAGQFEAIRDGWASSLPSSRITFKRVAERDTIAVLHASIECLADDVVSARVQSGRAALDLAVYRREFDRLQRAFSRLENYVSRQPFQLEAEIFEYPPDSITVAKDIAKPGSEVMERTGGFLIQELPVDSFGVSSFSIYISSKPDPPAEPLRIRLQAIETRQTVGAWAVDPAKAPTGWVDLALTHAIDESAYSLAVVIEWPLDTSSWSLALGPPHPYREFAARAGAGGRLDAPIALRVFRSLPGVHVPPSTVAIRPINAPYALTELVPYDEYGTAEQVLPAVQDNNPLLVSYDSNIRCITVHPHKGGVMTVARMNVAVPKHAWRLGAQIHLAHDRASPTQFGLMICTPEEETLALEKIKQLGKTAPSFSGWKGLAALEKKSIAALIEPSVEKRIFVYLLTRQAPDSNSDFAWARFDKFEFNILPQSTPSKDDYQAAAQSRPQSFLP